MIKLLGIAILLLASLSARENPFFPSEGETDIPMTTNISENIKPLVRAALNLPSTARVIESFSVTYKNLDGSVEQKSVNLNNTIDWHLPLFLSQSYSTTTTSKTKQFNAKSPKQSTNSFLKIDKLKFITFVASNREFKIITKDTMLRDFMMTKPHRIVCDFKREASFRSYIKKNTNSKIFKEVRIGNHNGYYRVVVELDGHYRYKMKKTNEGYSFELL